MASRSEIVAYSSNEEVVFCAALFALTVATDLTRQMSRKPERHDCTRRPARRLHLKVTWFRGHYT